MTEILLKDEGGATLRQVDVDGVIVPHYHAIDGATIKQMLDNLPNLPLWDDDVMLCSFPKTGSNWVFEILSMIVAKSTDRVKTLKYLTMMESQKPEDMELLSSPRVMNSHHKLRYLPGDMTKKRIKTILLMRNPKDTAVSYYNHMEGIHHYDYNGKWENWLPPYLRGEYEYGTYPDYLREWQEAIDEGVGFPLHVMYYEDLKLNGVDEINKLETFLELDLGDELKQEIIDSCHFDKMREEKAIPKELKKVWLKDDFEFYRKGQIGDWKNWFTVQQDEMFDTIWEKEAKGLKFSFTYIDPR